MSISGDGQHGRHRVLSHAYVNVAHADDAGCAYALDVYGLTMLHVWEFGRDHGMTAEHGMVHDMELGRGDAAEHGYNTQYAP